MQNGITRRGAICGLSAAPALGLFASIAPARTDCSRPSLPVTLAVSRPSRIAMPSLADIIASAAGVKRSTRPSSSRRMAAPSSRPCCAPSHQLYCNILLWRRPNAMACAKCGKRAVSCSRSLVLAGPAEGRLNLMTGPGYARLDLVGLSRVGSHLFTRWRPATGASDTSALKG